MALNTVLRILQKLNSQFANKDPTKIMVCISAFHSFRARGCLIPG